MPAKKKVKIPQFEVCTTGDELILHVRGELLPNSIYHDILKILAENMAEESPKRISIVAYTFAMYQLMRYSIPGEYVCSITIGDTSASGLPDAAGM